MLMSEGGVSEREREGVGEGEGEGLDEFSQLISKLC